ncbi:proteins containing armadillo/beta-catenin-like repeat [Moesziomyces antarcticus T-34]|uniref:Proteins containing armadillo/beta-catenin-like repeat n=1 Tax=Pseudozyma antarctica (strain T-34) TaxID=1151754 RepID=M9MI46_PSEA3|nr:proteins containing armadillo/beta-catenin-like repeat [Moesziomyces antarcticus T-34]
MPGPYDRRIDTPALQPTSRPSPASLGSASTATSLKHSLARHAECELRAMTMALPSFLGATATSQPLPMQLDLDDPERAISQLKAIRNAVIGSRTKKSSLVHTRVIQQLVELLHVDLGATPHAFDLVSLAATIVASLANTPAHSTMLQLMRSGTHDALLACLTNLTHDLNRSGRHILDPVHGSFDTLRLLESVLRALRSILLSVADQLSPSPRWGIGSSWGTKPAPAGVAISNPGAVAATSKIFGKSSRDSLPASPVPIQDVLMNSASNDNLRDKLRHDQVESEAQQQRELRRLARIFLARVYDPANLALLLGPLFMCQLPQEQTSAMRPSSTATSHSASPMRLGASSSATAVDDVRHEGAQAQTSGEEGPQIVIDVERLPMTVKTKILSVVEMICAILSGTLFIPGHAPDAPAVSSTSVADQISQRRERILDFSAVESPFAPDFKLGPGARGRSEALPASHSSSQLQAEVIRKGSRSRSRMKDVEHAGTFDTPPLPPWTEDEVEQLRAPSDLASTGPPTLLTVLLAAAESGFVKAQEAALHCLVELTRDEPEASARLFKCLSPSGLLPTSVLLNFRHTSSANVRLAAFCCLANIIKVHPFSAKTNQCVLEVLMELLDRSPSVAPAATTGASPSQYQGSSHVEIQIQAAFAIARLVADNVTLQNLATESYDALSKLALLLDHACTRSQPSGPAAKVDRSNTAAAAILGSIAGTKTRADSTIGVAPPTVDESAIRLREACLTALAALTFQHDEPRRKLIDSVQPPVLAMVVSSISFSALGVRVSACRLTRALSRSLSILRTSIVDAGVAPKLVALLQDAHEEEVVRVEATAAICNLVLDFSPMKKLIQELGGVDSLVELAHGGARPRADEGEDRYYALSAAATMHTSSVPGAGKEHAVRAVRAGLSGSQQLRLHALWALKNLLSHSDTALKVDVMEKLDFKFVAALCEDAEVEMVFKEQALNILRNAAASKESDVTFMVDGMGGGARLMATLEKCIWEGRSAGEPGAAVIEQAAFVLVNVATGTEQHRKLLLRRPNIMDALAFFCNHPWKDIRVAAARCIGNLLSRPKSSAEPPTQLEADAAYPDLHSEAKARLTTFGLDVKIAELAQSDAELDVRERAKSALNKLNADAKT